MLDGSRLVDMARVGGGAVVSPDGTMAVFEVRQYDWDAKKFDAQLWTARPQRMAARGARPLVRAGVACGCLGLACSWFGPLCPHACDFWPVQPGSCLLESSESTNQSVRPPLPKKAKRS